MAVAVSSLNWRDKMASTLYKVLYTGQLGQLRIGKSFISIASILKVAAITVVSFCTAYKLLSWYIDRRVAKLSWKYIIPLSDLVKEPVKGVMLTDGRWISYCEYGALESNNVVFYFHSLGSSRLERPPHHDTIARELNIRFIHVDRPGYGQSTVHTNRTYISFANDVQEIAKALSIERYAVLGVSSGACAHLKSKEQTNGLVCAVAISPELPYKHLPTSDFSPYLKEFKVLLKYLPIVQRYLLNGEIVNSLFASPEYYTRILEDDKRILYEHEGEDLKMYLKTCVTFLREGVNAYGIQEPFREVKMEHDEWQFQLDEITNVPCIFWHGTKNQRVPLKLVRRVVENMRDKGSMVQLHEVSKGHFFWMNDDKWRQVLTNMLQFFHK